MISAGNDATALVALWITDDMICWKPLVMPLSWFFNVVWMLMSPQIKLPFQPTPTPRERMPAARRSEEHTSELQSLMRSSYAVFCLKKKKTTKNHKADSLN